MSGCPTHENSIMLAKRLVSHLDSSSTGTQSSMRQPQSAEPFVNSYPGMARKGSSDALRAGGQRSFTNLRSPFSPTFMIVYS